jgi:hypothetical protein
MTRAIDDRDLHGPHALRIGWGFRIIIGALLLVASVSAVLSVVGRFDDQARARSDKITQCRSLYRTRIDDAQSVAAKRESERIDFIGAIVVASVGRDLSAMKDATEDLSRSSVAARNARLGVEGANADYKRAVKLSGSDPARFLEECTALPD